MSISLSKINHNAKEGPPKGGPMLYAIWLFYGFAICYNNFFNTAIINFQLLLYKNVMVLCVIKIYTKKNLKLVLGFYRSFTTYIYLG